MADCRLEAFLLGASVGRPVVRPPGASAARPAAFLLVALLLAALVALLVALLLAVLRLVALRLVALLLVASAARLGPVRQALRLRVASGRLLTRRARRLHRWLAMPLRL